MGVFMISRRDFARAGLCLPMAYAASAAPAPSGENGDQAEMARFIAAMPKAEYHVHLEGTLEAEMKFALARRNGLSLPYADADALRRSYDFHDLPSFLTLYYSGMSVLLKEQDFYDLAHAYLTKAASQNILYAEMFFDPQEHLKRGVPMDAVIGGITRARNDAQRRLGIRSQLILCFLRDLSAESAMAALDAALPMKEHLIGVGLDSDEKDNPPGKFAAAFAKARAAGLKATVHCDLNQKDSLAHIREAIVDLKVDRIDHGGNVLQSPDLVALAKRRGLYFTVCPGFSGQVVGADGRIDVVRGMLDQGLNVTINSDDPAYMGSKYLLDVLIDAQARSALTKRELVRIERNAFNAAWISPKERQPYLDRLDAFVRTWSVAA
jgi:adenosine deaminase